jgi:hypothetical protein
MSKFHKSTDRLFEFIKTRIDGFERHSDKGWHKLTTEAGFSEPELTVKKVVQKVMRARTAAFQANQERLRELEQKKDFHERSWKERRFI